MRRGESRMINTRLSASTFDDGFFNSSVNANVTENSLQSPTAPQVLSQEQLFFQPSNQPSDFNVNQAQTPIMINSTDNFLMSLMMLASLLFSNNITFASPNNVTDNTGFLPQSQTVNQTPLNQALFSPSPQQSENTSFSSPFIASNPSVIINQPQMEIDLPATQPKLSASEPVALKVIQDKPQPSVSNNQPTAPNVNGQTLINTTFEDGKLPDRQYDSAFVAKVKPQLLNENGNNFMRITAQYGDNSNTVVTNPRHVKRVRSTVYLTESGTYMPQLTNANKKQFYSVDVRFHDDPSIKSGDRVDGNFMEFFQIADGESEDYGKKNGIGPAARFSREEDGHVYFENNYDNETKQKKVDLGYFPEDEWHNFGVNAVWSNNANEAKFEIYVDGQLKTTINDLPSNLGPNSNHLPGVKFGLYGDNAIGQIDIDNFVNKQL